MIRIFLGAILCLFYLSGSAQPIPEANRLDSLVQSVDPTPNPVVYTDSLHQTIQQLKDQPDSLVRSYAETLDSLLQLPADQAEQQLASWQEKLATPPDSLPMPDALKQQVNSLLKQPSPDKLTQQFSGLSSKLPIDPLKPSVPESFPAVHAVQERITHGYDEFTQYQQQATGFTQKLANLPETAEQQLVHRPELAALQEQHEALQDFTQQPQTYQQQYASLSDQQQLTSRLQQELLSRARDHFVGHWPQVAQAQEKLMKLKKKHVGVPGGQEMLPKRNDLSGKPLSERLIYGGSVQVLPEPPLTVQAAPQLGYQFSKKWLAGLGAQYQVKLRADRRGLDTASPVYGGSAFTHYQFFRGFLIHAEGEAISQLITGKQDVPERSWEANWWVGLGKTYPLAGQWQGKVVLLYNLAHRQQSIYPKPWIVRFAFYRKK